MTGNRSCVDIVRAKGPARINLKEAVFITMSRQGFVLALEALASALIKQGKWVYVGARLGARRLSTNLQTMRIADLPEFPAGEATTGVDQLLVSHEALFVPAERNLRRALAATERGVLMVCTSKPPEAIEFPLDFEGTVATADAESIYVELIGTQPPPFGIAGLGLYAAATGTVDYKLLQEAAADRLSRFRPKVRELNLKALDVVYKSTRIAHGVKIKGKHTREEYRNYVPPVERKHFDLSGASSEEAAHYWREKLPVCDQKKCTCIECVATYYCPQSAISWQREVYVVDYDFCKGCGICARECPEKAITMKPADEVLAAAKA